MYLGNHENNDGSRERESGGGGVRAYREVGAHEKMGITGKLHDKKVGHTLAKQIVGKHAGTSSTNGEHPECGMEK
jgi:hypothetical protein